MSYLNVKYKKTYKVYPLSEICKVENAVSWSWKIEAGVSIKFEVSSQFEKSRWRYWQGATRFFL